MKMRMIKSPEEIELIKQGARIADLGGEAVVKAIKEGAAEHEIALASTNAMVKEIADTYPHSEIRDSMFQLFILFKFLFFLFLGSLQLQEKCGAQGCRVFWLILLSLLYFSAWTWFQSGINTDGAHNPVTTRRLRKGDILSLNCFPMIAG